MRLIYRWIDPEHLIQAKTWWIICTLAALAGLLFASLVLLMEQGEHSISETVLMRDKFIQTDAMGKELDKIGETVLQYQRSIRAYINDGDTAAMETVRNSRYNILDSYCKLKLLATSESKPKIKAIDAAIDSVLVSGMVALNVHFQDNTQIMTTADETRMVGLHNRLLLLTNEVFRIRVSMIRAEMEADSALGVDSFRDNMLLLSALAGLVFLLLIYAMTRTVHRVMDDRRAYRQMYEKQRKAADFTQNLVNILPIGYHSLDKDGYILDMNQTELDWLGYTKEEVVGKHITELNGGGGDPEVFAKMFAKIKQQGYMKNTEQAMLGKQGQLIPMVFNAKIVYDDEGNMSHTITTGFNFTERKKLENDLIIARQEAENAQHLKHLFMANMSHEIRTPLNAIIGFANFLGRAELNPVLKEYVDCIQISSANLLAIVNDILDFEKIQSGMLRIDKVEFDLPGLLHSVITMVRPSAEEKSLVIHLDADPLLPPLMMGDPMRLTQILVNLLGNAVKFTDSGQVTLRVRRLLPRGSRSCVRIRFEVEDSGIGIPATEQERIFERFIQADSNAMRRYGGTGLGLALVKMLVELQRGSISLVSEVGTGSTFTVEIPYTLSRMPGVLSGKHVTQNITPDFKGRHVLLIEDNPMNRRIAELQLLELGMKITQASNGQEAITLLRNTPCDFNLILMDIQMPEMDGYTTTQLIRTELKLKKVPIIAVTAHVLAGEREKVLASGMNDYLTKPVRYEELITALQRHLPADAPVLEDLSGQPCL
ncbi:MAG TPA: ATP-binding protein [Saprospiraceae bacterium]|nr:ATP-binding protein [Saprospiraceae bacterium]HPI05202.1 ATP-binding protein [Saprospiraceae bacterium]